MDFLEREDSEVAAFFANKTVLITGGTGFIGKLLIEKLLRACSSITRVYVIIREKRGVTVQQRLHKLLNEKVFAGVLHRRSEARLKVSALCGDTEKPLLALSNEDLDRIQSEVEVVIHSAATVKFNEPLAAAVRANVEATAYVIELCHRLKWLQSFVHVSTAYVNVNQPTGSSIEERIYPFDLKAKDVLELVARLPTSALEAATPHLLGAYPNTYTFTKRLAEELVVESGLPAAIVRPSVVVATCKEPFPGWIDNINGPTGFFLALGTGSLTTIYGNWDIKVDLVPADFVVNCIIVTAFKMLLFHRLPMELADFLLCRVAGKQLPLRKLYTRMAAGLEVLNFFFHQDWDFKQANAIAMYNSLGDSDRYLFPMVASGDFKWATFLKVYLFSIKYFILNEDLETVPAARAWRKKLAVIHYGSRALTALITAKAVASFIEFTTGIDVPIF
ncbi:fatty acyl-CoA reductase 1-like [Tropilaelaps mercedesae]|uniref:Fatty acyl-CoA reductase n=1 Tax=Tropilaelaps mercedesae TaxID=418985 RepID=A0A1V9X1Z2_9ACAR|nr:fatty acyl-CoA reductase 1-like [Tropilaelaps mercedesae]